MSDPEQTLDDAIEIFTQRPTGDKAAETLKQIKSIPALA